MHSNPRNAYQYLSEEERRKFKKRVQSFYLEDSERTLGDVYRRFTQAGRKILSDILKETGEFPRRSVGFGREVMKSMKTPDTGPWIEKGKFGKAKKRQNKN
jgi:hypothetical protein